jgi:hypothetical protein
MGGSWKTGIFYSSLLEKVILVGQDPDHDLSHETSSLRGDIFQYCGLSNKRCLNPEKKGQHSNF